VSHLAIALGIRAVEAGYRGYFTTATDMVAAMTTAYADGSFATKIRTYTGPSVLGIDDVGITPFDRNQANAFFKSSTGATRTAPPPSSRPTAGCRPGPSCSAATASSPPPSWTASSTAPPSFTSKARPGDCVSIKP
jgi:IstB-like ATP binding protein